MSVPRNWTPLSYQRSPSQTLQQAEPQATDGRFKSGAFFLLFAWLVILFSLRHSLHHYTPRHTGIVPSILGALRSTPPHFLLTLPLSLIIVGYQFAIAFSFAISPLNNSAPAAYIYGLGWGPIALIFLIQEISGYVYPNEDRELIRQRRLRGQLLDQEMGYTRKPPWWRRLNGSHNLSVQETIARNAREVGGDASRAAKDGRSPDDVEMTPFPQKNAEREVRVDNTPAGRASARRESRAQALHDERMLEAARALFPAPQERKKTDPRFLMSDEIMDAVDAVDGGRSEKRPGLGVGAGSASAGASARGLVGSGESAVTAVSERSNSTGSVATTTTTMVGAQPQVVRSMLDI